MSDILVFSNENADAVINVLTSVIKNRTHTISPFTNETSTQNVSQLKCIVLCFRENEIGTSLGDSCQKLEEFLVKNQINSKIPIIPIVYKAESAKSSSELSAWFNEHKSLNFLKNGLVWFKNESAEEFKNKIRKAQYRSGYPVTKLSHNDDDFSGKNANIAATIATVVKIVCIVVGIIVGSLVGGLIGGLVLGGFVAAFVGTAIGVVSGALAGWLTARGISGSPGAAAAKDEKKRSNALQQQKELTDRNAQWEIFQEHFFAKDSSSLRNNNNYGEQGSHLPLFRPAPPKQQAPVDEHRQGLSL